jgi:hypothetical protein
LCKHEKSGNTRPSENKAIPIICFSKQFQNHHIKTCQQFPFQTASPLSFHLRNYFKKSTPNQHFSFILKTVIIGQFFKSHEKWPRGHFFVYVLLEKHGYSKHS